MQHNSSFHALFLIFICALACANVHLVQAQEPAGRFTVASLNVDGMPRSVKILGVADLTLNPDAKEAAGATAIGGKLKAMGYDIVAVEENFNYNDQLMQEIASVYGEGTHRGGIDITAASYGAFIAQSTVFDTDGLNLLYRKGRAAIVEESWTGWQDKNGYTEDGADRLIDKGYRYYMVTVDDTLELDVYVVHMDAECTPADLVARESNMRQVVNAILSSSNKRPILIIGDTNCRYTRDRVEEVIIDGISADARFTCRDIWIEHAWDGEFPAFGEDARMVSDPYYGFQHGEVVDKIFYINNCESPYHLQAEYYLQDTSFVNEAGEPLADHWPVVTTFAYYRKVQLAEADNRLPSEVNWQGEDPRQGGEYYVFHPYSGTFLSIQNGNLSASSSPSFLWTMTPSGTAMNMQGLNYYFYLNRTGTPGFYSATPALSTDAQTILVQASSTGDGVYKLYRTKDVTRYLNYNGSEFTGAKTLGQQNDWLFISAQQFADSLPNAQYEEPLLMVVPQPGQSALPGRVATSLEEERTLPSAVKTMRQGQVIIRIGQRKYDVQGREKR